MEIKPPPPDNDGFLAGPYLQNVTRNSIVVMWETHSGHPGLLEYGGATADARFRTAPPVSVVIPPKGGSGRWNCEQSAPSAAPVVATADRYVNVAQILSLI